MPFAKEALLLRHKSVTESKNSASNALQGGRAMNQSAITTTVTLEKPSKNNLKQHKQIQRLMVTEATDISIVFARFVASLTLIAIAPLLLLIAIAIKITSPGPVLYKQVRVGRFGRHFTIIKFRTMVTDAEKFSGAVLATPDDARITSIGRLLRATHIDELPQLWNVVAGHMGFIGPRPERPVFVDNFKSRIPHYDDRHLVHPGITGLAQILLPYDALPEEKLRYDLTYLDVNLGWRLKTHIIIATAMKMARSTIPFFVRIPGGSDYRVMLESFLKEGQLALFKV